MMNEETTHTAGQYRWGGLFLILGICTLGLSITAYNRPDQQIAPLNWLVYLLAGIAAALYGFADLPTQIQLTHRQRLTKLAKLLAMAALIYAFARGMA